MQGAHLAPGDSCSFPVGCGWQASATDEYLLGCVVPRKQRKGKPRLRCKNRGVSYLGMDGSVDGAFHEDEREALEALCFLSSSGMQLVAAQQCQDRSWPQPLADGFGMSKQSCDLQPQPQQQHSKGSCETGVPVVDSGKVAEATVLGNMPVPQLSRQYSPSSDVSSGAYQAALLLPDTSCTQQQEQLAMAVEDIHPAALPPVNLPAPRQMVTAAKPPPSACHKKKPTQQQHVASGQQPHPQQQTAITAAEYVLQPVQSGCTAGAKPLSSNQPVHQTWTMAQQQQQQQVQSQGTGAVAASADTSAALLQLCGAPGLAPLLQQHLLSAMAGSGGLAAPAGGALDILAQLPLSAGLPPNVLQLLLQVHQQQQLLLSAWSLLFQHGQPPTAMNKSGKLPVCGGRLHVHIAHMIEEGRRKRQQEATAEQAGVIKPLQQQSNSSSQVQVVPQANSEVTRTRPASQAAAAAVDDGPRKKLKKQLQGQQPPEAGQLPAQQSIPGSASAVHACTPNTASIAAGMQAGIGWPLASAVPTSTAAMPAAAPGGPVVVPALGSQVLPAKLPAACTLPPAHKPPPAAMATGLQPVPLSARLSTAVGAADGAPLTVGTQGQLLQSLWGVC